MQNLVARRERKEVLEEEEEEEEEESRERETLKCNFLYILKICSVYIFYQCPHYNALAQYFPSSLYRGGKST